MNNEPITTRREERLQAFAWLYEPRCSEWDSVRDMPADLPQPILGEDQRDAVAHALRYAYRAASMCGKTSVDPDALIQNAVTALCGPLTLRTRVRNMSMSAAFVQLYGSEHSVMESPEPAADTPAPTQGEGT